MSDTEVQLPSELSFEVTISRDKFTIEDAYKMRERCQKEAEQSLLMWEKLDESHRKVLDQIVRRAIESMHSNTDRWVPHCMLEGQGGDHIDVRLSILLADIETNADLLVDATDFEMKAMRRRLLANLKAGEPELSDEDFLEYCDETLNRQGRRLSVEESLRLMNMLDR